MGGTAKLLKGKIVPVDNGGTPNMHDIVEESVWMKEDAESKNEGEARGMVQVDDGDGKMDDPYGKDGEWSKTENEVTEVSFYADNTRRGEDSKIRWRNSSWDQRSSKRRRTVFQGRGRWGVKPDIAKINKENMLRNKKSTLAGLWRRNYLLDPKGRKMRRWDILMLNVLVYIAIMTPFEVAFLEEGFSIMFYVNRITDFIFLIDIGLTFFLPYQEKNGTWVADNQQIVVKYLRSWLLIDLFSIIPFDLIAILSSSLGRLKILRIIRLLRLVKLLRMFRAKRMFQRWESSLAIDYSVLSLLKFVIITVTFAHWLACAWHLVISLEGDPSINWVSEYRFLNHKRNPLELYVASLYWAVATISTIGFGYAYMVGAVCGIVSSMDEKRTRYYQQMDGLNSFMTEKGLGQELRMRLRDYFRFKHGNTSIAEWHAILSEMSPALRGEVAEHVHARWINNVTFFRNCPQEFYIELAMCLKSEAFAAHEVIIKRGDKATKMYICERGVLACRGRVITSGKTFGEDMIHRDLKRAYVVKTLTHCVLLSLSRQDLFNILENFPTVAELLRKAVVRITCRETVRMYMEALREAAQLNMHPTSADGRFLQAVLNEEALPMMFFHLEEFYRYYNPPVAVSRIHATKVIERWWVDEILEKVLEDTSESFTGQNDALTSAGSFALPKPTRNLSRALTDLLTSLGMSHYRWVLLDEKVTLEALRILSPADLRLVGIPIGDCIRILEAAKTLTTIPSIPSSRRGSGNFVLPLVLGGGTNGLENLGTQSNLVGPTPLVPQLVPQLALQVGLNKPGAGGSCYNSNRRRKTMISLSENEKVRLREESRNSGSASQGSSPEYMVVGERNRRKTLPARILVEKEEREEEGEKTTLLTLLSSPKLEAIKEARFSISGVDVDIDAEDIQKEES